jgi:hypothetical protein
MNKSTNNRGSALISVLMLSVVVAGLSAVYVIRSVQSSHATRSNLDGEKALSIAEGGLDLSTNRIAALQDGNISGQLGGGTYSVSATSPYPGVYTVVSTATYDGVTRSIEATIQLIDVSPLSPPGGLTIIDDGSRSSFSARLVGNAFIITGFDTNINGSLGSQPTVAGIAVYNTASANAVLAALHANGVQNDNIKGTGADPSVVDVSATSTLTFASVEDFANQLLPVAHVVVAPGGGNSSFGTDAHPQITYYQGNCNIGGNTSGAGILVVDGTLSIKGNFDFKGLILLTGKSGSPFDLSSRGNTNLHGGIIVLNPAGSLDLVSTLEGLDFRGNINIYHSVEGMNKAWLALNGAGKPTVLSWRRTR